MSKITVIGIGPGSAGDMTQAAVAAIGSADVIVGYKVYIPFVENLVKPGAEIVSTGMKQERDRVERALAIAAGGRDVCVVSSGDSGIYGMASLVYEMKEFLGVDVEVEVIPGISAFQKAASILGAPMGHDFCVISLSDLLTPWQLIEKRIKAAASADFVTAVYNPRSHGRYWQLFRLKEIFMEERAATTPVGYVRQAGREGERAVLTTLEAFDPEDVDMFTVVIIGNSMTRDSGGRMLTPRGYYSGDRESAATKVGQSIMIESFRTIEKELQRKDIPLGLKWPLLHAIHTTADFDMERILRADDGAVERLDLKVKCYLNDPETAELASKEGITRTQAGIRRAVAEHPDALFVFGNAPTALLELSTLVKRGTARPCGIIAAPVGFVHVCESKHSIKPFTSVPKIIVEGRKGGSNLAATLVNSILCWPDAEQLKPGRDV